MFNLRRKKENCVYTYYFFFPDSLDDNLNTAPNAAKRLNVLFSILLQSTTERYTIKRSFQDLRLT